jgi:hypothetical protein
MAEWNGFKGRAKRLEDLDITRAGRMIGVGEDEIHAIMEVEARGSGFDKQGRPAMLFEPHIFWRELGPGPKRDRAVKMGLAYPQWQAGRYPADSYPRLEMAMAIDETAALRSASWGLGQVLGNNHKAAGYATPQAMVRAFMEDEEFHLGAMINFIRANKIDDEIRRHDWTGFARVYNGPGHARHDYAGRLARAYAKWRKIKDTPWTPEQSANETAANDPKAPNVVFEPAPKPAPVPAPPDIPKPETPASEPAKGFWALISSLFKRRA